MSNESHPKQTGETSRRGRGRPRKVPPPPYEDPPPWYPRVTRSLTPAKVAAAEAAYIKDFFRRVARGENYEYNPRLPRNGQGVTEETPIVIDDDNREDTDLGGSRKGPLLKPGVFYQMVSMEEDMDISDDDKPQGEEEVEEERPAGSWPPGWGPGLFKLVPIPPEELVNYDFHDLISVPPQIANPTPVQGGLPPGDKTANDPTDVVEVKQEVVVPLDQGPSKHRNISPWPSWDDAEPNVGDPCTQACWDLGRCVNDGRGRRVGPP